MTTTRSCPLRRRLALGAALAAMLAFVAPTTGCGVTLDLFACDPPVVYSCPPPPVVVYHPVPRCR